MPRDVLNLASGIFSEDCWGHSHSHGFYKVYYDIEERDLICLWWLEDGQAQNTLGSSVETVHSQNQQAQRCTELDCCGTWQVRMENRSPPDRLPGFVCDSLSIDPSPEAEYWVQCQDQGPAPRVQILFPMITDLLTRYAGMHLWADEKCLLKTKLQPISLDSSGRTKSQHLRAFDVNILFAHNPLSVSTLFSLTMQVS